MSRQQTLINEIRARLNELESLLNPTTPPTPTVVPPPNFQFSDSILKMNETAFKITSAQRPLKALPTNFSFAPLAYISAVSKKLTPKSIALCKVLIDSVSLK